MTYTAPFPNGELWPQWWDMYWWVNWLSYGPVMGLFFVRLGYGRTLRQFVVVNWLMPSIFGLVWFSIFGGTVLHAQFYEGVNYYDIYKSPRRRSHAAGSLQRRARWPLWSSPSCC